MELAGFFSTAVTGNDEGLGGILQFQIVIQPGPLILSLITGRSLAVVDGGSIGKACRLR